MIKKRPAFSGNPDLHRGMQVPGPPIAETEAKLLCWLTPESFKPLRLTTGEKKTARCLRLAAPTHPNVTNDQGSSLEPSIT